jgi:hypothetical protein
MGEEDYEQEAKEEAENKQRESKTFKHAKFSQEDKESFEEEVKYT